MRKIAAQLLVLASACACMRPSDDPRIVEIDTPRGSFDTELTTVDPVPQTIVAVAGADLAGLIERAASGPAFVATYLPGVTEPDLEDYDSAFRIWQSRRSPEHSPAEVIDILGAYLGSLCVETLHMEWVTVTDQYGTDYAVRGIAVEVVAFPFSSVAKRIDSGESDFLYPVYYAIKDLIDSEDSAIRE